MEKMNKVQKKLMNETRIFEKIELCWFSIDDMEKRKGEFRNFYQEIVDKFIENEKEITQFLKTKNKNTGRRTTAKKKEH